MIVDDEQIREGRIKEERMGGFRAAEEG